MATPARRKTKTRKSCVSGARCRTRRSLPPPIEECIGPYRLCFELGSGGMGAVYLARDERIGGVQRFVALKRLKPGLPRAGELGHMFVDEARIAALIRHPNVCAVLDVDTEEDPPYLAMELLAGESLSALLYAMKRREPMFSELRRAALIARIVADACEGLHAAHELRDEHGRPLGVVHRDVSLDNVMVTYDGVAKLHDFGVARAEGQRHRTATGILKGKFSYIAPEVLEGRSPDRRADIWALGVVLWELLTERRLFRLKNDALTLRAVLKAPVPAPSQLRPELPPDLNAIVLSALMRAPGERYATARELGRELNLWIARHGEAVALADVADWMNRLFPRGVEQSRRLLAEAARLPTRPSLPLPLPPPPTLPALPSRPSRSSRPPRPAEHTLCSQPTRLARAKPGAPRRRHRTPLFVGLLLSCLSLLSLVARDGAHESPTRIAAGSYLLEIAPNGELKILARDPAPAAPPTLARARAH